MHSVQKTVTEICLHINADKTEYMCLNQQSFTNFMSVKPLKWSFRSSILKVKVMGTLLLAYFRAATDKLSIVRKTGLPDKMKLDLFHTVVITFLLYERIGIILAKRLSW